MLSNPNKAYVIAVIGRALVVLLNRQTREESQANITNTHNMMGFTSGDARSGCIGAKYWLKHKTLQDWQVEQWTRVGSRGYPRLAKYWKQLDEEAQLKAARS
jgi:hypothetical protein